MKKIEPNEIQGLLLSMLKSLKLFFEQNGINYYLAGGTLLGAIRHNGFIPWDDDVDIFIKMEDFFKLKEKADISPYIDENKRYKLLLPAGKENVYPFFKLIDTNTIIYENNYSKKHATGVYIDIFQMSYWPNDIQEAKKIEKRQKFYKKLLMITVFGNLKKTKYKLMSPFAFVIKMSLNAIGKPYTYWSKKLFELGPGEKTEYLGNLSWTSGIKERYPAKWYSESVEVSFEGDKYNAPAEYDSILKAFYGDYMQMPPVEKRVMHSFEAYYIK